MIWFFFVKDIGGNKTSSNMNSIYYRDAVGCIVVFDVSQASTFDAVAKLKVDLDNKVRLPDGKRIPCILIANKVLTIINRRIYSFEYSSAI